MHVPSYLVETYVSRSNTDERVARECRARAAAEELTRERTSVRFERSIHIPEDEICFFVFEAGSSGDAALVAERARLAPVRIVEVVSNADEECGSDRPARIDHCQGGEKG